MDDNKFNKENLNDYDLTFTKEDRLETFKKIQDNNYKKHLNNSSFFRVGKRYVGPILGTVMVFFLAIGLLLPYINSSMLNSQQLYQQTDISFSALLMGEDSTGNSKQRSTINILLTYNGSDNSMKLVPIPRDTYVEIFNSEGKIIAKDKLTHASALNPTPEPVLKTVSYLFGNIPIDYYAVLPEEDIYGELGINEEMARENRYTISDIAGLMKERLSISQIKNLLEGSKTNIQIDIFNEMSKSGSIQVIDMEKGIEKKYINGIYYVEINQNLLETTSDRLKQHVGDK